MYKLVIAPRAQRGLKKIKKVDQSAVRLAIEELKEDPLSGKSLDRELTGRLSIRIGLYRIVYKVNTKDEVVNVLAIDHRSIVYQ